MIYQPVSLSLRISVEGSFYDQQFGVLRMVIQCADEVATREEIIGSRLSAMKESR